MFIPAEIIRKKRDGNSLEESEIKFFVEGFTRGTLPDYQMSALLMAIVLKGMTKQEVHFLTQSMLHSGDVLSYPKIPSFKVDKHSTGGVGDKTSLILAPIVAAAGLHVPMISGRGLGHTGGTLDKLESIPGFSTQIDLPQFKELVFSYGLGLIGQTKEICPADKKIYALRDVTGTVESIPLICASIMSKKLAEGIDGLVLDVKFGSGAFMKTFADAEQLARSLMDIAVRGGKRVCALLTDMNQPLGRMIGNSLEVEECLSILKNEDSNGLYEDTKMLSLHLSASMLELSGSARNHEEAYKLAQTVLDSGKAMEKFEQICKAQGGDLSKIPKAKYKHEILSPSAGYIESFFNEGLGYAAIAMKAGRLSHDDKLDPSAGIEMLKKRADKVEKGEPLARIYANDQSLFAEAEKRFLNSTRLSPVAPTTSPLIAKILKESDL
jgi:pyrimidine-nucleoside phosphorylase